MIEHYEDFEIIVTRQVMNFSLVNASFDKLEDTDISPALLEKLKNLEKQQQYPTEDDFIESLEKEIEKKFTSEEKSLILKSCHRNYQFFVDLGMAPGGRHLPNPIPISLPISEDYAAWQEVRQGRKNRSGLIKIGHRLFENFFIDELLQNWYDCRGEFYGQTKGLRLRFSPQADILPEIPWELLCNPSEPTQEFLIFDPATPIVRSPRSGRRFQKLPPMTLPLKMLVIIATPDLEEKIDPHVEKVSIEGALAELLQSQKLEIDYLGIEGYPSADRDTLHHILTKADPPYDIVHFVGHGAEPEAYTEESEGALLFVDPQTGYRQDVLASNLAKIVAPRHVRIVILQACNGALSGTENAFQGVAQRLIAEGLPAAVAMQGKINQDIATCFCRQLYQFWLSDRGLLIEQAMTEARLAVRSQFKEHPSAWWLPVLFIRGNSNEILKIHWNGKETLADSQKSPDAKPSGDKEQEGFIQVISTPNRLTEKPGHSRRPSVLTVSCFELKGAEITTALNSIIQEKALLNQSLFEKENGIVTLEKIIQKIKNGHGRFNILHLQVRGIISHDSEDNLLARLGIRLSAQSTDRVLTEYELEKYFNQIPSEALPKVIVLDIYPTSEFGEKRLFEKFGAVLAKLGVPAVITMLSDITHGITNPFHQAFYHELSEYGSGQIDLAFTKGRQALAETFDELLTANTSAWMLPILHLIANVQVQFETRISDIIEVSGQGGKIWRLSQTSQFHEGEAQLYRETQLTDPPLEQEISEFLLNNVNAPFSRNHFLFLYGKPRYGKTLLLKKILYKQLQYLEAGILETIPVYIDLSDSRNVDKLSDLKSWTTFIKTEMQQHYSVSVLDFPETSLPEQPRMVVLLDNVHTLSEDAQKALHRFILDTKQSKHYFILTCASHTLQGFTKFKLKGNTLELKEFPLDAISQNSCLKFVKDYKPLKEMVQCPEIYIDFERLMKRVQNIQSYPYSKLLENWILSLFERPANLSGRISVEQILAALESLALYVLDEQGNKGIFQSNIEEHLATVIGGSENAKNLFVELMKKYHIIKPKDDNPHLYEFTYRIVQAFLAARILSRKVEQNFKENVPLSFFEKCCSEDETQYRMLEFLIEVLRDHKQVQVVYEQIVVDALRAGNLTILANVINPKRFNYSLTQQTEKFVFISLLEQCATGDNTELFIELMKCQKITVNIKTNWTIKCHHHIIEKMKELLNSEDDDEFRVAVSTLPWIVSEQSVPLVLKYFPFSRRQRKFYQQILAVHKDWFTNGFVIWLANFQKETLESSEEVYFRLQELIDSKLLDQEVMKIIDKIQEKDIDQTDATEVLR